MSMIIDKEPLKELPALTVFPGERRRQITNLLMHAVLLLVMIATIGCRCRNDASLSSASAIR